MPSLLASKRVCRRLFDDGTTQEQQEARNDNTINILQEIISKDRQTMLEKYNYDSVRDRPVKGPLTWYKLVNDHFVQMEHADPEPSSSQSDNESTPVQTRSNSVPNVRKRRNHEEVKCRLAVKKNLSREFD